MGVTGFAELTLQARDPEALARFYARAFGMTEISRDADRDRSLYARDPEGNVVEAWDLFERADGSVDALH